ncbi:MAG: TIGR02996 domain-containing protein [Gemmataceae bacterium]|nr:TIGR02996 domain-containing protein [Gemmataceae bacterium]
MSDEPALLAAILANPDEDTPRLAYADWLDEYADTLGRARAEFIRLQIEAAAGIATPQRRKRVETRCAELESTHGEKWFAPVWRAVTHFDAGGWSVKPGFRRGFVERATAGAAPGWVSVVAARCPLREVEFLGHPTAPDPAAWAKLAESQALAGIRRMDFEALPISIARALFPSPHLTGLQALRLGWVTAESMEAIAASPAAAGLRELRVSGGYSTAPPGSCFRALLSAKWPAIEDLRVDRFEVTDARLRELTAECARRRMRRLHVTDLQHLTGAGARAAAELVLSGAPSGFAAGSPMVREAQFDPPPAARELSFRGFYGEGDNFAAWVRAEVPPGRFDRLAISGCRMNASGAVILSAWAGLADLVELDLSNNWIGDLGAVHLADSPHLANIEQLFVAHNDLTKRGKDALKKRFGRRVRIA